MSLENAIKASSTQTKEVSNEPAQTKSNPFGNTPSSVLVRQLANLHLVKLGLVGRKPALGLELQDLDRNRSYLRVWNYRTWTKVESKSGSGNSAVIQNPQATSAFGTTGFGQKPQATSAFGTTGFGQKAQTNSAFGSSGFAQNLKQALHLPSQVEVLFLDSQSQDQQAQDLPNLDRAVLQFSATRPRLQFLPVS